MSSRREKTKFLHYALDYLDAAKIWPDGGAVEAKIYRPEQNFAQNLNKTNNLTRFTNLVNYIKKKIKIKTHRGCFWYLSEPTNCDHRVSFVQVWEGQMLAHACSVHCPCLQ